MIQDNVSGIIVLDGADASGKSTLARLFIERYGARYLHCGLYKDVFSRHLAALRLAERWASNGELVVIDRLWLSELAYGDTLRGGAKHPISARCFDRLLLRMSAVQVICVQKNYQEHLNRFIKLKQQREEKFNENQIVDVIQYYLWLTGIDFIDQLKQHPHITRYAHTFRDSLSDRSDVIVLEFEDACKDLEGYANTIINTLVYSRRSQNQLALTKETPNITGSTHLGKYLLVGEQASSPRLRYPFISRDDQLSASLWLNKALDSLKISEHNIVMTNAQDCVSGLKTSQELKSLVDKSQYYWQKIISLGRVAALHLNRLGLKEERDFMTIPHPQWARRFKYRDHQWYTNVLGEALGIKE